MALDIKISAVNPAPSKINVEQLNPTAWVQTSAVFAAFGLAARQDSSALEHEVVTSCDEKMLAITSDALAQ